MPNLLAMTVVVAFSSCLDVAAIEMEMGKPLDFNGELQTVRFDLLAYFLLDSRLCTRSGSSVMGYFWAIACVLNDRADAYVVRRTWYEDSFSDEIIDASGEVAGLGCGTKRVCGWIGRSSLTDLHTFCGMTILV